MAGTGTRVAYVSAAGQFTPGVAADASNTANTIIIRGTAGATAVGALTCTSVAAGSGTIAGGAITGSSLNVGSGTVTCGSLAGGAITGSSLNVGSGAITAGVSSFVGNTSGSPASSGNIGELLGTLRSFTGGRCYSTRSTTVPTPSETAVVSTTLNKGLYLVTFKSDTVSPSGVSTIIYAQPTVGGSDVFATSAYDQIVNGFGKTFCFTIPILITSDTTAVALKVWLLSSSAQSADHEIWAVRIW
jgi:hypothetical protein